VFLESLALPPSASEKEKEKNPIYVRLFNSDVLE
jgi:hypothetical protein